MKEEKKMRKDILEEDKDLKECSVLINRKEYFLIY